MPFSRGSFFRTALLAACFFPSVVVFGAPPLGVTFVSSVADDEAKLTVFGDTAYLATNTPGEVGYWQVGSGGAPSFISPPATALGSVGRVSPANLGSDGSVYGGVTYFGSSRVPESGAAVFDLDSGLTVNSWDGRFSLVGVRPDRSATANALGDTPFGSSAPVFLQSDGSVEALALPGPGVDAAVLVPLASGGGAGISQVPNTIGSGPALWDAEGNFSFLFGSEVLGSAREREDGGGINVAISRLGVKYGGSDSFIRVLGPDPAVVTESDFVLFPLNQWAFYPGIVPAMPTATRPLIEVFPELLAYDINALTDVTSKDGNVFISFTTDDGIYLFGAPDPSVIPEPTNLALIICCLSAAGSWGRRAGSQ